MVTEDDLRTLSEACRQAEMAYQSACLANAHQPTEELRQQVHADYDLAWAKLCRARFNLSEAQGLYAEGL